MPDEKGETRAQAPVSGLAVDLLSADSPEEKILNIRQAIVKGRVPQKPGEMLVGEELAISLRIQPGDTATLISSTMYGSMSITNFVVVGMVRFGIVAMDKGTVIADISDAQQALDIQKGAGEILGFFADDLYHDDRANTVTADFNLRYNTTSKSAAKESNVFSPVMGTLRTQSGLSDYLDYVGVFSGIIIGIFVFAMSIVLWNAGLTGSLRRYGEIGVRLAVGEDKRHIYLSLLAESLMVGFVGSVLGTGIGLAIAYYGQVQGLDIGSVLKDSSMMLPNIVQGPNNTVYFCNRFSPRLACHVFRNSDFRHRHL